MTQAPINPYTDMDASFTSRTVPWMKIGPVLEEGLTVEEAIPAAGLDFTVSKRAMQYQRTDGTWKTSDKRTMLTRDDNDQEFEAVSFDYVPVQFGEALTILSGVSPTVVAAGTLRGGRQGFMVVEMPTVNAVAGLAETDPTRVFGIVRTSHDRTKAVEFAVMPLRGKCMNMLALASMTKGVAQRWSLPHSGTVQEKLKAAVKSVEMTARYALEYQRRVEELAAKSTSLGFAEQILRDTLKTGPRTDDAIQAILNLWQHDETVGFQGQAWGLVNAVSSYMQWERSGGSPESRFIGAMDGTTYRYVNQVAQRALVAA